MLKPTPRQLEHGLHLHAESLVFESYGFAPRAAVDGEKFKAAMESGASEAELTDLSEEISPPTACRSASNGRVCAMSCGSSAFSRNSACT